LVVATEFLEPDDTLILRYVSRKGAKMQRTSSSRLSEALRLCVKSSLGRIAKDQPIEIGVVSQRVQVVIVLGTHPQIWL
jgi:hypothetical protein